MPQFSTNEAVSLEKTIELNDNLVETDNDDLDEVYEIKKCLKWLQTNNFQKVCLQFPDHLLPDSTEIAMRLQQLLGQTVYVLGDTAYESCCVDYVAAAHVNADCIIHFGPTCFSNTLGDVPFLYIYEKKSMNIENLAGVVSKLTSSDSNIILLLDTEYIHYYDEICDNFSKNKNVTTQRIDCDLSNLSNRNVVYVGNNLRKLMNINLNFGVDDSFYFNPNKQSQEIVNYNVDPKILKKRYFLMEKIRDAETLGIVIGTIGIRNYLEVIDRTKKLIELSNKKYYLISVGKPTVAKLANFSEVDVYVMITCSMNDIFESRDFYKPIVTAMDVEVALNENSKDLQFCYDYNSYLNNLKDINVTSNETDVSLLTGKLRSSIQDNTESNSNNENQVALKVAGTVALNTNYGAGFLNERSWKGLEQNLGQTEVMKAQDGRKGIAQSYDNEKS